VSHWSMALRYSELFRKREDHWAVQMVHNSFSSPPELKIIFSCVSFHFGYLRFVLTSFWICSSMLLQTVTAGLSIEDIVWTAR
jgi:membrane protein CcdC involved in cytochrome C biogenesis